MNLNEFLLESNKIEGILIPPTEEQIEETNKFLELETIRVQDMCNIVHLFAPGNLIRSAHGMNVYVGNYVAPAGGPDIPDLLAGILHRANALQPIHKRHWNVLSKFAFAIHYDYESLHPFMDGNGRSGRLLWLWCMGGNRWLDSTSIGFKHQWYYDSLAYGGPYDES